MQLEAGPSAKKRQRSENWLEEDKILIKELVRERVRVIENKNTDTNTNSKKVAAWTDLKNSFNCMCKGTTRTLTQLKGQWSLAKIKAKRDKAFEHKGLKKTGGGSPPAIKPPDSEDISVWLPLEFTVDKNEFVSDQIYQVSITNNKADFFTISNVEEEPKNIKTVSNNKADILTISEEDPSDIVSTGPGSAASLHTASNHPGKIKNKSSREVHNATPAEKVASMETECRRELHSAQMANERKKSRNLDLKGRNLDLKGELLTAKIEYYKRLD